MSIINKEVNEFSVQAYVNNSFKTVTKSDILGKWNDKWATLGSK